ncbi:MAG: hypothetical protein Kapaf2KO_23500 [Candidatus Kapaibacteriales bacterium]
MRIYDFAESLMRMDDGVWRRHANPWSVWTRVPIIFPLAAVLYLWPVLGWWTILPVGIIGIWTYLNPRVFGPIDKIGSWSSKGVYGEKIFLAEREKGSISKEHIKVANFLTVLSGISAIAMIIGIVIQDFYLTAIGTLLCWVFKMWFVDRMVWVFEDYRREYSYELE